MCEQRLYTRVHNFFDTTPPPPPFLKATTKYSIFGFPRHVTNVGGTHASIYGINISGSTCTNYEGDSFYFFFPHLHNERDKMFIFARSSSLGNFKFQVSVSTESLEVKKITRTNYSFEFSSEYMVRNTSRNTLARRVPSFCIVHVYCIM